MPSSNSTGKLVKLLVAQVALAQGGAVERPPVSQAAFHGV
jgi:hypothetical protein